MTEKLSAFDLETFMSKLVDALPKLAGAVIIIALGFWVSSLIGKLLIKGLTRKGVDASIHSFLRSIVVWLLRFAVILSALSTLGFNLISFIAALGAAGLTAGMGLQNSIAQFASGIQILVNKPFKSGDFVELENISGRVHEIKLMYTVFTTVDNKRVIVPNSHITSNNIINYNAEGRRRLDMTFSVSYSDDIVLAKQVLYAQALKNELIYKSRAGSRRQAAGGEQHRPSAHGVVLIFRLSDRLLQTAGGCQNSLRRKRNQHPVQPARCPCI